jgi:uroporphyrinogen decarboxylase
MANPRFENALNRVAQRTPPVWFMRQAGRYHRHYQALRAKYSFMELCKQPELAAQVALGPMLDFDFDVAILFSDLLFPLEAMGMPLTYGDSGPQLGWKVDESTITQLQTGGEVLSRLMFQKKAMQLTRAELASNKSLIGFVGGPWTLFAYAVQGSHEGGLLGAKKTLPLFSEFCRKLVPLLVANIQIQLEGGAEVVMIFDTAAGELAPEIFRNTVAPQLGALALAHPGKLGYYSKGTQPVFLNEGFLKLPWAGLGYDHRWELKDQLGLQKNGFVQGNFDQALLFCEKTEFQKRLRQYLAPLQELDPQSRAGWVCGLGHGVLPKTPEDNVHTFIETIREAFK